MKSIKDINRLTSRRRKCIVNFAKQFSELTISQMRSKDVITNMKDRPNAGYELFQALNGLRKQMIELFYENVGKTMNIRPSEFMILNHIVCMEKSHANPKGVTVSALAEKNGVTKSHVSQILKTLEARHLIIRRQDPNDRRTTRVFLSEKAIEQFNNARDQSHITGRALERMGKNKSKTLVDLIIELSETITEISKKDQQK